MGVYFGSNNFGDVKTLSVHGRAGLGLSELAFSTEWLIHATRDSQVFRAFGTCAWIQVHPEGSDTPLDLGRANPETAWQIETRPAAQQDRLLFRLQLIPSQLLAIESMRSGRALIFTIDIRGNSSCSGELHQFADKHQLRVGPSDWADILRHAGAADILLVGVQIPLESQDSQYKSALSIVREANQHLVLGHYAAAVAECRRALESLWKAADLGKRAAFARKRFLSGGEEQKRMSKRERELAFGEALKNYLHIAHHVGDDAEPEVFGRPDAALAVGATAALVSSLVLQPDLKLDISATQLDSGSGPTPVPATADVEGGPNSDQMLATVRENLKANKTNRPKSLKSLKAYLNTLFQKKLSTNELDGLIERAENAKLLKVSETKVTYQ